jgi:hypothetical protein
MTVKRVAGHLIKSSIVSASASTDPARYLLITLYLTVPYNAVHLTTFFKEFCLPQGLSSSGPLENTQKLISLIVIIGLNENLR